MTALRNYVVGALGAAFLLIGIVVVTTQPVGIGWTAYAPLSNPDMVRGLRDPHGVFIGSFRQRKDIIQIVDNLIIATTFNQILLNLRDTL